MSLSSLQAQLAALKDGGGRQIATGTTLTSSKRHGDAVGRGVSFSVQHGHHTSSASKYKASLIYATAARAADVPLSTLEQLFRDAVASDSLNERLDDAVVAVLLSDQVNDMEIDPSTNDDTMGSTPQLTTKAAIQHTLVLLATVLVECDADSFVPDATKLSSTCPRLSACLNVLEYLVRKFDVHQVYAVELLWTLLPVAETMPRLLHQCLILVDWTNVAQMSQSYLWLRPYCVESTTAHSKSNKPTALASRVPRVPTRRHVAAQVVRHVDILRTVCTVTRRVAQLHQRESESLVYQGGMRHGMAHLLSYTAALVVEGLQSSGSSMDQEAVVRTLLPVIVSSLDSSHDNCGDVVAWGMIVASSLAEALPLSTRTSSLLCSKLVALMQTSHGSMSDSSAEADQALDQQINAMACLVSIVVPRRHGTYHAAPEFVTCYLPLCHGDQHLGCPVASSVYTALVSLGPVALPELLGHVSHEMIVAPLLAALLSMTLQNSDAMTDSAVNVMVGLMQQDALRSVWNDARTNLVASVAAFVLDTTASFDASMDTKLDSIASEQRLVAARTMLHALHQLNVDATERGMASAVEALAQQTPTTRLEKERLAQASRRMALLLEELSVTSSSATDPLDTTSLQRLLPPRVALEHSTAEVRLQAIQQLKTSLVSIDGMVLESMFRRMSDPDAAVATSAGQALVVWLEQGRVQLSHDVICSVAPTVLQLAYQSADRAKEQTELFRACLAVVAYLARDVARLGDVDLLVHWQYSLELLVAVMGHDDEMLGHCAAELILIAFEHFMESRVGDIMAIATELVLSSKPFIDGLQNVNGPSKELDVVGDTLVRRTCVIVLVAALEGSVQAAKKKKKKTDTTIVATKLCLLVVEMSNDPMPELRTDECERLTTCLQRCIPPLCQSSEQIPSVLIALASTESKQMWVSVAIPTIFSILEHCRDRQGKIASPYTVLFETAFRPGNSDTSIKHFLSIARKVARNEKCKAVWLSVVPALVLLEHSNQDVRILAANLLSEVGPRMPAPTRSKTSSPDWSTLSDLCERISTSKSFAKIGGASFLSSFLTLCVAKASNASSLSNALLTMCVYSALSTGRGEEAVQGRPIDNGWLTRQSILGGCEAAARLLAAMEGSGEDSFPLLLRWNLAGKILASTFIAQTETEGCISEHLAAGIVKMLKGAILTDPSIVISSGPRQGTGGRSRSYSIGKMDGVTFITPYPGDMTDTLIDLFAKFGTNSGSAILVTLAAQSILESKAWGEFVFKKLARDSRKKLAQAVLHYVRSENSQHSDSLFAELPMDTSDIIGLFGANNDDVDASHEAILVDYVHLNCDSFLSRLDAPALIDFLFHRLELYANKAPDEAESNAFAIQSVALVLDKLLLASFESPKSNETDDKTLQSWIATLLQLVTGKSPTRVTHSRTRTALLSLLAALSSKFPDRALISLVPAISSSVESLEDDHSMLRVATSTFTNLVPVYVKHASAANQSVTNLLHSFLVSAARVPAMVKERILLAFAVSLVVDRDPASKSDHVDSCVGALQALFIANEVHHSGTDVSSDAIELAVDFIEGCPPPVQLKSLRLLLSYAIGLLSQLADSDVTMEEDAGFLPTPLDIGSIATTGSLPGSDGSNRQALSKHRVKKSIRGTIQGLLRVFCDGVMLRSIRAYIGRDEAEAASMSLCLWQDLLLIQSSAQIESDEDNDQSSFQEAILNLANESREFLQSILPSHVFYASVTALIADDESAGTRSRALRLIADRATSTEAGSPEVSLLVDMLPTILGVLETSGQSLEQLGEDLVLTQSALVSIEHIARSFQVSNGTSIYEASKKAALTYFVDALQRCNQLLMVCQQNATRSLSDLVSTACLCCSSLLRVVGAASISVLPKLMKCLVKILGSINEGISAASTTTGGGHLIADSIAQLSIVRALTAVIESTPQFITPHLPVLLSKSAILSQSLRQPVEDASVPLPQAVDHLVTALATQVASRLLVPVASVALTQSTGGNEILILLSILKNSTELASSSVTVAHKKSLLDAITAAFDWKGIWEERSPVVSSACALFDAMVLKLSEIQLRRVYTSLREWRGDLDPTSPDQWATKRFAFWSVSARLSKELRSIFLPCLGAALDDMIAELNLAAVAFDRRPKSTSETKKRKTDHVNFGAESMRVVPPILSTLESALRADAHQGGTWIRSDGNRKYEAVLEPLGKLLLSRIPSDFPLPSGEDSAYTYFVQGPTDGSVIGCLTALAAAGGNEQLWKPLNHAILQACSDEKRSEVRRAGLSCMLDLLKSLGEEYMVLLPENLPLLSELLEDTNEEVASLAKEIVTMAEELLGESLEDSLR